MAVPCAPNNDYEQLVADPQVKHNALVGEVGTGDARYPAIRNPVRLSGTAPVDLCAPPRLGEHTRAVLQHACGLTPEQVDDLVARGIAFARQQENTHA